MLSSSQLHQFEFSPAGLLGLRSPSYYGEKSIASKTRRKPASVWKIKSSATPTHSSNIETSSINNPLSIIENYNGFHVVLGVGMGTKFPELKATVSVKAPAGETLELEFVSSGANAGSDEGRKVQGTATKISSWSFHSDIQYSCKIHIPADFGEVGAVRVENKQDKEIFINKIDLTSNGVATTIQCNSWVQPSKDNTENRVFFTNKSYLPSDTPKGILKLREQELESLRGERPNQDQHGQRKDSDRIYAYDKYNDRGKAEKEKNPPVLGGVRHPYPRRCRTGRARFEEDGEEYETIAAEPYYVPKDEAFSDVKSKDFKEQELLSKIQGAIPIYMTKNDANLPFPGFTKIDNLFDFNVPLNNARQPYGISFDAKSSDEARTLSDGSTDFVKALLVLLEKGGPWFQFKAPELIIRDRFSWLRDEEFGRQTLAGINPLTIELVKEWPIKSKLDPNYGPIESAITNEAVEKQINGMTVEEAINNKRLFVIDYHDLLLPYVKKVRELEGTTLYGSRTLFFLTENETLMPIAIELTRPVIDEEAGWRHVFTPSSDATNLWLWKLAKVHALAHDSGYHQLIAHWLRTHCCTEPFIIAANRQLSAMHPIYKLLHPHFRYTLALNAIGRQILISVGGVIESCFSPLKYSMELSSVAYDQLWRFDMEALPADLIRRGMAVEDPTADHGLKLTIEDYPYAKDGLDLWGAIKTWVIDYVKIYYKDAIAIANDTELQAWWTEVRTKGHEDKKDEPWWPVLNTRESLIQTLTTIIWIASGQHAAVNFGQYGYASYFPSRPTIARTKVPLEDFSITEFCKLMEKPEEELMKCYPSQVQAIMVIGTLNLLSNHSPDEEYIGDKLEPLWTGDEHMKVDEIFTKFQRKLSDINWDIDNVRNKNPKLRNRTGAGVVPYTLLKRHSGNGVTGMGVPNSISI